MVRTNVWAVLALGIAATTAAAQEKTKISKGPPPEIVTVVAMDEEQGVLDLEYVGVVEMEKVRVKNTYTNRVKHEDTVRDEVRTLEAIIDKPIYKPRVLKLKLKFTEVFDPSGRKLDGEVVWKRLAVGATVVIPVDGMPVDSDYLRALAKDTLVLVSPQCATWRRNLSYEGSYSESPVSKPPASRHLNLLGNPIELTGTKLDGSDFDWSDYEGKVVLVDFWATWCGPCLAEAPNVKKNYDKYHDRGFEVVAISLDTKKSALEKYIQTKEVPWVNLFEAGKGWKHPMAVKYGVSAIPTVFLVNRDGNVVSLRARGAELGKQLKKLLGTKEDLEREIAQCSQQLEESPGDVKLLTRRAQAYIDTEQWELAAEDWRSIIKQQPELAVNAIARFKEVRRWDHAADFAMAAINQEPDVVDTWLKAAPIFAQSEDSERYRDFCRRMLDHFKDSDDWRECCVLCKSCLLLPGYVSLNDLPQAKVEKGFSEKQEDYMLAWTYITRAILAYRNGDPELALKSLEESEKHRPVTYAKALNYPLLALVHQKLGNTAKANGSLTSAQRLLEQLTASETAKSHHDVLIAALFFDEAKAAISRQTE